MVSSQNQGVSVGMAWCDGMCDQKEGDSEGTRCSTREWGQKHLDALCIWFWSNFKSLGIAVAHYFLTLIFSGFIRNRMLLWFLGIGPMLLLHLDLHHQPHCLFTDLVILYSSCYLYMVEFVYAFLPLLTQTLYTYVLFVYWLIFLKYLLTAKRLDICWTVVIYYVP